MVVTGNLAIWRTLPRSLSHRAQAPRVHRILAPLHFKRPSRARFAWPSLHSPGHGLLAAPPSPPSLRSLSGTTAGSNQHACRLAPRPFAVRHQAGLSRGMLQRATRNGQSSARWNASRTSIPPVLDSARKRRNDLRGRADHLEVLGARTGTEHVVRLELHRARPIPPRRCRRGRSARPPSAPGCFSTARPHARPARRGAPRRRAPREPPRRTQSIPPARYSAFLSLSFVRCATQSRTH